MNARLRRRGVPVLVGAAVAAATFAVVLTATRGDAHAPAAPRAATVDHGRAVFAAMGCGSCHRLAAAGSAGQIGPVLDQVLGHHTRASLRAKITDPGLGTIMPGDFSRRLSGRDLDALLDFLLAARNGQV